NTDRPADGKTVAYDYSAGAPGRHMRRTMPTVLYIDTIDAGVVTTKEPDDAPDLGHYDSDCVVKPGHLFAEAIGDI
ncbi:MAG: hypothetical protein IKI50_03955, partial [Clostridia bacterium]|nr:hypothetical protein [Clostridia bacterium]